MDNSWLEAANRLPNIPDTNHKDFVAGKELPCLEFTLKRDREVKDIETSVQEERNVLRRSGSSAFSRYNTASNSKKAPSGNLGKSVPIHNSIGVLVTESVQNVQSHSNSDPPNQLSNVGSNKIDMGSTNNKAFNKPLGRKNKSVTSSSIKV